MSNPDPASGPDMDNPFPGPVPYRAEQRDKFFGRDELEQKLAMRIYVDPCTVVFGPSGAGKSSILQAKVIPQLLDQHHYRLVHVDGWPGTEPPLQWWLRAIFEDLSLGPMPDELLSTAKDELAISSADTSMASARPDGDLDSGTNKAEIRARRMHALRKDAVRRLERAMEMAEQQSERPILMFLDQLEQLLFPGRDANDVEQIFAALDHATGSMRGNVQLILALREDYLGRFRSRAHNYRELLSHGFRVGPLTVGELTRAVIQAAAVGSPPQIWTHEQVNRLMLEVRERGEEADDHAEAQAAFGQIVCGAVWQRIATKQGGWKDVNAQSILDEYIEHILDALGPRRAKVTQLLEEHLVDASGLRKLITEDEARAYLSDGADELLGLLLNAAVLRGTEHHASRYFELGHDWMARRFLDLRRDREQREKTEQQLRQQAEAHELERRRDELLREKLRKQWVVAWSVTGGVMVTVLLGAIGGWLYWDHARKDHLRKFDDALKALDRAKTDDEIDKQRESLEKELAQLPNEIVNAKRDELIKGYKRYWHKQALPYAEAAERDDLDLERRCLYAAAAAAREGVEFAPNLKANCANGELGYAVSTLRLTEHPMRVAALGDGSVATLVKGGTVVVWDSKRLTPPTLIATKDSQALVTSDTTLGVLGPLGLDLYQPLNNKDSNAQGLQRILSLPLVEPRAASRPTAIAISQRGGGHYLALAGSDDGTVSVVSFDTVKAGLTRRIGFRHVTADREQSGIEALAFGPESDEFVTASRLMWASVCSLAQGTCHELAPAQHAQAYDVRVSQGFVVVSGQRLDASNGGGLAQLFQHTTTGWQSQNELPVEDQVIASDVRVTATGSIRVVSALRGRDGRHGSIVLWPASKPLKIEFGAAAPSDVVWVDDSHLAVVLSNKTLRYMAVEPQPMKNDASAWEDWQRRTGLTLDENGSVRDLWTSDGSGGYVTIRGPLQ